MGTDAEEWRTLSARVLAEEHDRYAELAKLRGISVSAFVRESMQALYPAELHETHRTQLQEIRTASGTEPAAAPSKPQPKAPEPEHTSVMGYGLHSSDPVLALEDSLTAAFASMDQGPAPTRAAAPLPPGGPPVRNDQHPCRHLNIVPPPGLTRADCQGACQAQHNRPCHWPSNVAAGCTYYRPQPRGPHNVNG